MIAETKPKPIPEDCQCPECGGELIQLIAPPDQTGSHIELVCLQVPFLHRWRYPDDPKHRHEAIRHKRGHVWATCTPMKGAAFPRRRGWAAYFKKTRNQWSRLEKELEDGTVRYSSQWHGPEPKPRRNGKPKPNGRPSEALPHHVSQQIALLRRYADYGKLVRGVGMTPRPFEDWVAKLKT